MDFNIDHLTTGGKIVLVLAGVSDANFIADVIARRRPSLTHAFGAVILTLWTLWLFS